MDLAKHITWKVEEITWPEIFPIWQNLLWPERPHFDKYTTMINNKDIDMDIRRKAQANFALYNGVFFGVKTTDTGKVVACNSGHQCSNTLFRSRGLYVYPEFTGRGMAHSLLAYTAKFAQDNGFEKIWSLPTEKALPIYNQVGYETMSPVEDWESYKKADGEMVMRRNAYAEMQLI
jgi:N-acetylglutamate synthase-like GNAT family acetyltransferase